MNKIVASGICICSLVVMFSCTNTLRDTPDSAPTGLPNGYIPNVDEISQLHKLQSKANIIVNGDSSKGLSEAPSVTDPEKIDQLINLLHATFGDNANKFYGVETKEIKQNITQNNSRSILSMGAVPGYSVWLDSEVTDHWGVWWCYFNARITLNSLNLATGETKTCFVTKGYYTYNDDITSKSGSGSTPLAPASSSMYDQIAWAVEVANSGIADVTGNTKYGWFPRLSGGNLRIGWWAGLLKYGFAETYTTWTW